MDTTEKPPLTRDWSTTFRATRSFLPLQKKLKTKELMSETKRLCMCTKDTTYLTLDRARALETTAFPPNRKWIRNPRPFNPFNDKVSTKIGRQDLDGYYIQKRRKRTPLPHTPRRTKRLTNIAINKDSATDVSIQKFHPRNEVGTKTHEMKGGNEKLPIHTVGSLFLV